MKTCQTCNASHKNTVGRVLRCMGCVATPQGNTHWRPMLPTNAVGNATERSEGRVDHNVGRLTPGKD